MHRKLLGMYLSTPFGDIASSQLVFHALKRVNLDGLLEILLEFYQENEANLARVLEVAHEIKVGNAKLYARTLLTLLYRSSTSCSALTTSSTLSMWPA